MGAGMSELPDGWELISLGTLIELNPKTNDVEDRTEVGFVPMTLLGKSWLDVPSFELRQWASVKKGYTHFRDGDVLLAKITPCFENGKAGLLNGLPNGIGSGSTEYFVCRTSPHTLDARYLLGYLKTDDFVRTGAMSMTGSVGHKRIPKEYLLGRQIPLPPRNEQTRIANQLDTLLTRVQACNDRFNAIPALLKRFRQTVLDAGTTGGLTDDWRDQSAKPLGHVRLREVASAFSYGSAAKSSKSGDVPVLRMGNIQSGRLDWSDLVFTSDKKEIEKYKLDKGDVLFNRTNSPELVGKTAVFQGEREAVYAGYLIRVRCLPELLPEYLNYCLGSKAGRDYCWSVKSDGVSQSNINAKKLAAFTFQLPELSEQIEIVRRVEALFALADRIEARFTAARARAQRLTPLVLAKAFRGELVPQDPNDEPASALLARIASSNTPVAGKNKQKVPVARKKRAQAAINL